MPTTILVVDDDRDIRNLLELYLRNEGYQVVHASNGAEALKTIEKQKIDLVLLDIMMPEMDGLEACIAIRTNHQMPIIMLTANANDIQVIQGLSMGADDYVTKPFQPLQVMARVKAQLRRYFQFTTPTSSKEKISLQYVSIDVRKREVKVEDKLVSLTPREYDILLLLAQHADIVMPTEQIYERIWKEEMLTSHNTVMVHIRKIREKIERDPKRPTIIQTVWGVGYKAAARID
ncbi:response regulator transcription factor [Shimazuella alba]|uniref:Response regulator n=1 Tax=Shimazuella alba TaxID=2690964 RepID=A0A6I4VQL6_9BACL|nr:response regulator transcription factor [Shimazuella alba]MXQ53889.1 response regulator [Shimazuella alba]